MNGNETNKHFYSPELQTLLNKLRPFQKEAFDYFIHKSNGRLLIADEMGLGKTVTSLSIMLYHKQSWPLLILCPSSLRYIWSTEIEKFIPSIPSNSIYIIQGFNDVDFLNSQSEIKSHIQIIICTYSLLQKRSAAIKALVELEFGCVIMDESHNLKDRGTQRSQYATGLIHKNIRSLILLSGTPALSKPCELYVQLHLLNPSQFPSWNKFIFRYCNAHRNRFGIFDYNGISHADELHAKMKDIMIRRLKSNVLHDLPKKQRMVVPVTITECVNDCKDIMKQIESARNEINTYMNEEGRTANPKIRTLLSQAYQQTGIAKSQSVSDYIIDIISGCTSKIIVFAHHKAVMDKIESNLAKYKISHVRIDGTTPSDLRCKYVQSFQNSNVRIALLSMTAAGVGLTLTAASNVIFAELYWTPGVLVQAEDRAHRIGQVSDCVNIMYCVCRDEEVSVDGIIWNVVGKRFGGLKRVVDGLKGDACIFAKDTVSSMQKSEEEELASFFASNNPSTNLQKEKVPSKGSIQSFFQKMKKGDNWSCSACTFQNQHDRNTCVMCHTSKDAKKVITASDGNERVQFITPNKSSTTTSLNTISPSPNKLHENISPPNNQDKPALSTSSQNTFNKAPSISSQNSFDSNCFVLHDSCLDSSSDDGSDSDDESKVNKAVDLNDCFILDHSSENNNNGSPSKLIDLTDSYDDDSIKSNNTKSFQDDGMNLDTSDSLTISVLEDDNFINNSQSILSFVVSKNTGRIALFYNHPKGQCAPLNINFDINDVAKNDTTELTMPSSRMKRTLSQDYVNKKHNLISQIVLNDDFVRQLLNSVDCSQISSNDMQRVQQEIQLFASTYLTFNNIEKKILQSIDIPTAACNLRQVVSQVILTSSTTNERYANGAMDKAILSQSTNTTTQTDTAVLNNECCAWCANPLPQSCLQTQNIIYCSQNCAEEGRLKRGGMYASKKIRGSVFALEQGVCQKCGVDAHSLFLRISALEEPCERLNVLCNANWRLPVGKIAYDRFLNSPKESDFWQVDHVKPVAEGGGACGIENFRTLCTPCHKIETDRLHQRLKVKGNNSKAGHEKQMDIRSAFGCTARYSKKSKF